jgi:ATP-dependent DNA helicase RecQ
MNLPPIAFVDTEIDSRDRIVDIGSVKTDESHFHQNSLGALTAFLRGVKYVCGHNIFQHDLRYIDKAVRNANVDLSNIVDTLYLSPLFFPQKADYKLAKDDKMEAEEVNNPLNDAIKAKDLFLDEWEAFKGMNKSMQQILCRLLRDQREFRAFFSLFCPEEVPANLEELISGLWAWPIACLLFTQRSGIPLRQPGCRRISRKWMAFFSNYETSVVRVAATIAIRRSISTRP